MSAANYHPCPVCGQQNPSNATFCVRCRSPFQAQAPRPPSGYQQPAYQQPATYGPTYSSLYDPNMTLSVLKRIAGMATAVRIITALSWAGGGGLFGLLAGAMFAAVTMGRDNPASTTAIALFGLIGAAIGGFAGWIVSAMLVVWIEWAGQVLAALDHQAQR